MFVIAKKESKVDITLVSDKKADAFMDGFPENVLVLPVETEKDLADSFLTMPDFIALWERAGQKPLKKFQSKRAAAERVFPLLEKVAIIIDENNDKPKVRKTKGVHLQPTKVAYACRGGTKQARLVDALSAANGATMEQLREAVDHKWGDSAIKSALYWDMNSVKGYGIRTEFDDNNVPTYFLVLPEGMETHVPHKVKKKGE